MKLQKLIILVLLLFVGTASAVPTKINDREEYSRSLNTIATVVMNWYGSLIRRDEKNEIVFDNSLSVLQQNYRSQYPKNINQIIITKTEILKLDDGYQFITQAKIIYQKDEKAYSSLLSETFTFNNLDNFPFIESIVLNSNEEIGVVETTGFDRQHYKIREFIYAWLSHLDGTTSLDSTMNADAWFDSAIYTLEIGGDKSKGSVVEALAKRSKLLAKGGHLLRSLDVLKVTKNSFTVEIILEWKGINTDNKPLLARIRQSIEIKIKKNKSWKVISIKEKHLLPIIAPWMGMLC